jgi:hypothetical protein
LEVLFPEKSAFWKYCSQKKQRILEVLFPEKTAHFGSTVPGKNISAYRGRALHTHAGPILPFFIFPGTVLPFFYFSVVRKVPEKPVLFLPHPSWPYPQALD